MHLQRTSRSSRAAGLALAGLFVLAAACSQEEPLEDFVPQAPLAPSEPERQFLSQAQEARARHYWTREALEPYGVLPADTR
jgi:hypothetical protein